MADRRWIKRIALAVTQVVFLVVCLEIGAVVAYPLIFDRQYDRDSLIRELRATPAETEPELAAEADEGHPISGNLLHPYAGFVRGSVEGVPTNEYGFYGPSPVVRRATDQTNVLLVGGSVALHMYRHARDVLEAELRRIPGLSEENIEVLTLALPGYKQPQQLLALTYMMYLGAQYDIVINLDGFNEVALPFSENLPSGTFVHHPRLWNVVARLNATHVSETGEMAWLRERRRRLREIFGAPSVSWSNLALLVWKGLDRQAEADIRRADESFQEQAAASEGPPRLGPEVVYDDDWSRYFMDVVTGWARASSEIHRLGETHGFRYFHFLQPNQYVEGSKPLSPRELRIAHLDALGDDATVSQQSYKWAAEVGYPVLQNAGQNLTRRGVDFVDLTMVFEGVRRTLYDDMCCHLNREGYRRLARRIGREVAERMGAAPTRPLAVGARAKRSRR